MTLSDTQRVILSQASERDDGLAIPPDRLPGAARQKVAAALIRQGLVSEEDASTCVAREAWQIDGRTRLLRITDTGLRAIGIEADEGDAMVGEPDCSGIEGSVPDTTATSAEDDAEQEDEEDDRPRHERNGIDEAMIYGPAEDWQQPADDVDLFEQALAQREARQLQRAAHALLVAWDASPAQDATDNPISRAIEALRAALASKPARTPREPGAPRKAREGTKQEAVLALLRRDAGATIAQICEATSWQQHTVRGFFAALKKKGIAVTVLERVRENKEGGRGSYSVYHLPG